MSAVCWPVGARGVQGREVGRRFGGADRLQPVMAVAAAAVLAGVYVYNRNNPAVVTATGFQVPQTPDVRFTQGLTVEPRPIQHQPARGRRLRCPGRHHHRQTSYLTQYP
jgi:hypothetical protein